MFQRVRRLRISLAAKCQLLFGTAVLLIIASALFVPWHRIEQLTEQLNERAAGALAEHAIAAHLTAGPSRRPASGSVADFRPMTQPVNPGEGIVSPGARFLALTAPQESSDFDHRAMRHFARRPESMSFADYYDRGGGRGYRYAQPLYWQKSCLGCHTPAEARAAGRPAPGPTTTVAGAIPLRVEEVGPDTRRAGIVSVDIGSRIDATELLLNRVFILGAGVLAGTLAIITFYVITTGLILQPVRILQETAEKVSRGDLNIRSDISTGDEFQQLSETFNTMLANLKESDEQLRAINKGLDLKLGQLAETNVTLYESNRLKSEFLANVSHELRTPLNSILGFADLLKDSLSAPPDAKTTRYLANILRSGRSLLDLINDLLDLAKIEAGRMEVRSEPLSLGDLFEALGTLLKPLTEPRSLHLVSSVGPDVPIVHADPGKLQQVLYNLLSNAIKFSPDDAAIFVAAALDGPERVRISVTDQGPGISPEKHAVIFEKFRQLDGSATRTHSGTGLGLAISRELVTIMGGTIGVVSTPGDGATFWLSLPLVVRAGPMDVRNRLVVA